MPFADLHIHSTASDGTCDPHDLASKASASGGLHVIALTDHDTLAGIPRALAACADAGIGFVPGVEITTKHDGRAVHMLGYFVDHASSDLAAYLSANRARRERRAYEMADRLAAAGYPVSAEAMRATGETPNRPLLARLLIEQGCVANASEAFSELLGARSPYYVDAIYPETIEAIRLIREAGGHAFIAHPARYRVVDLIEGFAREGMTGLEAYHTLQTPAQSAELVRLARELGLCVSGGSDWHGDDMHGAAIGGAGLDEGAYRAFAQSCGRT